MCECVRLCPCLWERLMKTMKPSVCVCVSVCLCVCTWVFVMSERFVCVRSDWHVSLSENCPCTCHCPFGHAYHCGRDITPEWLGVRFMFVCSGNNAPVESSARPLDLLLWDCVFVCVKLCIPLNTFLPASLPGLSESSCSKPHGVDCTEARCILKRRPCSRYWRGASNWLATTGGEIHLTYLEITNIDFAVLLLWGQGSYQEQRDGETVPLVHSSHVSTYKRWRWRMGRKGGLMKKKIREGEGEMTKWIVQ